MIENRKILLSVLCVTALAVRLVHLEVVRDTAILDFHRSFLESDMRLFDDWAHRIADGDVLGREIYYPLAPWQRDAAPLDRWQEWYGRAPIFYKAPFYAYLIALLYWLFGDAMLPLALLQIMVSVASVWLLFRITEGIFGQAAGFLAAGLLALYAPDVHFDVVMLRGPWILLSSLLVTWHLVELRSRPAFARAVWLGLALGGVLLVNEGFLTLPILAGALLVWWVPDRRLFRLLAGLLLGILAVAAPVLVRNLVVGAPAFKWAMTGSTVLAMYNTSKASPYFFELHPNAFIPVLESSGGRLPATLLACLRTFGGPGEIALFYLRKVVGLLIPFEGPDNANFYYAALKDPLLGLLMGYGLLLPLAVAGLALVWRRWRQIEPLLPAALSLTIAALLTLPVSRHRATLAVYLMPLAGMALAQAGAWLRAGRFVPLGGTVAAALLVSLAMSILQSQVVFRDRPSAASAYRASEFLMGADFYAERERLPEAVAELWQLLRLNPDRSVRAPVMVRLALLESRQGHTRAAQQALEGASLLASTDAWLLLTIGDVYSSALHDRESARASYRRAAVLPAREEVHEAIAERLRVLERAGP